MYSHLYHQEAKENYSNGGWVFHNISFSLGLVDDVESSYLVKECREIEKQCRVGSTSNFSPKIKKTNTHC